MMKHQFIYQHMGLGDHLICNGLVRSIIKNDAEYFMFVKPHNIGSVSYMYRDISNLKFVSCNDGEAISFINYNKIANQVILIGFNWVDTTKSFEENFYIQHGILFEEKWNSFRCERDSELEQKLYDRLDINEPYIFVHDDDRFKIDKNKLPSDIRIVSAQLGITDSIFSYAKIIENATEVHCIESCFAFMVDLMALNNNFFIHRYARPLVGYDAVDLFGKYKTPKEILT